MPGRTAWSSPSRPFEAGQAIAQGRKLTPALTIIARAHSDAEVDHLTRLGADTVIMGERENCAGEMIAALETDPRFSLKQLPCVAL